VPERARFTSTNPQIPQTTNTHTTDSEEYPMFSNHPYIAQQLVRDRQERLRQLSQQTHLRREARRIRREQREQT
jgi:hypothetical protein